MQQKPNSAALIIAYLIAKSFACVMLTTAFLEQHGKTLFPSFFATKATTPQLLCLSLPPPLAVGFANLTQHHQM